MRNDIVSKITLTYREKNICQFQAEGQELTKSLGLIRTLKQNTCLTFDWRFQSDTLEQIIPVGTIKILIGTNNWGVENARNKLENKSHLL